MTPAERAFSERYQPNSDVEESLREAGYPAPDPPQPSGPMPLNDGLWAVPGYAQLAAIYNWASRSFHWTYDNAIKDSRTNALVMRDDYVIKPALRHRTIPLAQCDYQLEALDQSNPQLKQNAEVLTKIIHRLPRFQQMKRSLLDYFFFGRSATQWLPVWDYTLTGERQLIVADWQPIHPDSIVFKYSGDVGVLVNLTGYDGNYLSTPRGPAHFFTPEERELIVVGEFEPESVDYFEPDKAGAIKGLGYRGTLYWLWWLREKLTSILMDFLEKVGSGITIFYYEQGNDKSKREVTAAAKQQVGNNVFIFPRDRDGRSAYAGPGIERIEVSMRGAETFIKLFNLLNDMMRFAIMGEIGTTQEMVAGLGSGVGEQHGITADQRLKYDAVDLEWPMQQLVNVLNRWNCPGYPPPLFKFLVDKRNPEEFAESLQIAMQIGLTVAENQVRDELSFPKPQPGEPTLGGPQAMQPTAVGAIPSGMPISAPTGPEEQDGQMQPDGGDQGIQGIPIKSSTNGVNRIAGIGQ